MRPRIMRTHTRARKMLHRIVKIAISSTNPVTTPYLVYFKPIDYLCTVRL